MFKYNKAKENEKLSIESYEQSNNSYLKILSKIFDSSKDVLMQPEYESRELKEKPYDKFIKLKPENGYSRMQSLSPPISSDINLEIQRIGTEKNGILVGVVKSFNNPISDSDIEINNISIMDPTSNKKK